MILSTFRKTYADIDLTSKVILFERFFDTTSPVKTSELLRGCLDPLAEMYDNKKSSSFCSNYSIDFCIRAAKLLRPDFKMEGFRTFSMVDAVLFCTAILKLHYVDFKCYQYSQPFCCFSFTVQMLAEKTKSQITWSVYTLKLIKMLTDLLPVCQMKKIQLGPF